MIQNISSTQSRQNFGMAMKTSADFPAQFEKVYNRKGKKAADEMLSTIAQVKGEQAGNNVFDLHLTGVGFFGGIKTKITSETEPTKARTYTIGYKIVNTLLGFLPNSLMLKSNSDSLLNLTEQITNPPRPLSQRVKDIVD